MNGLNVGLELKKANPAQETMRLGLENPLGKYQSRPQGLNWLKNYGVEIMAMYFAQRLNDICPMEVREAQNNDRVVTGVALIAPGNHHMVLTRNGGNYLVKIKEGPRVHYQRPSVDVLFQSVAKSAARNVVGVILTGMGANGAKGMLASAHP